MNLSEIKDKSIAVLLSGGVDSSVVVHELAQQGLHPDCFYIKIGPEERHMAVGWRLSTVTKNTGIR